jgi:CPA1 family monovalent cation:H+ antiporter
VHGLELIFILLAAITVLAAVAERTKVPYPVFFVLGGLALGLIPGMPAVELDPETVFVLFLPPVLFAAAYDTSWRDFRANLRSISLLAVGLVFFTIVAVAAVAHIVIPDLGWPAAFLFGAIVAPPDAVAATAVFQRLGVPRRLVTVLEGESLVNDASALVAYRFAIAAVVSGGFSLSSAAGGFVLIALGGIAVGLVAGWLMNKTIPTVGSTPVTIVASLLAPGLIYIAAERLEVSGVLATVVAGLVHGRSGPVIFDPSTRLRGGTVWGFIVFLINGLVFILIGLQLHKVWAGLDGRTTAELVSATLIIVATVVIVRIMWVYAATCLAVYLPRLLPRVGARDHFFSWRIAAITSWAGLRGVVSLAAALALPREAAAGTPFPQRDLIIFLTFTVILATLVGQGLTLAPLVRRLGVVGDGGTEREEMFARREVALSVLGRLDALAGEPWLPHDLAKKVRYRYSHLLEHLPESLDLADLDTDHVATHDQLRREVVQVQRRTLIDLRNRGVIGDDALRRVERDLDLEELRTEI